MPNTSQVNQHMGVFLGGPKMLTGRWVELYCTYFMHASAIELMLSILQDERSTAQPLAIPRMQSSHSHSTRRNATWGLIKRSFTWVHRSGNHQNSRLPPLKGKSAHGHLEAIDQPPTSAPASVALGPRPGTDGSWQGDFCPVAVGANSQRL